MARGAGALGAPPWAAAGAALFVAALVLAPVIAVIWTAGAAGRLGPGDWAAVRFSLTQAALSALLSAALAVPVARALARRRFPGRGALVTLLGAPFILPVVVAVFGLLAVFGRNGIASNLLDLAGQEPLSIYGLHGVVLAHVFFNLPLATRLLLQGWLAIPGERFRLAAALALPPRTVFRLLELPMLVRVLPGAAVVIFVICLSSFAVVLILGGGPAATTVELAIYQAFRFEFDLGKAAALALVQLALAGGAAMLAARLALPPAMGAGLDRVVPRWDADRPGLRVQDALWIGAAAGFLLVPLAMIVIDGVPGLARLPGSVWTAAGRSVAVALVSTALAIALALALASRRGELLAVLAIAVSPLVLGTGLFLILRPVAAPGDVALPVTALVNALMALPFALRAIRPELEAVRADYGRLCLSLGLTGRRFWTRVALPRLRRPLGFAAGLAAALSMGDLGVIALFADPERATLPLQMYRLMGAYRTSDAAGAALLLLLLSLALFWAFDRGGRIDARA
ncbi:thiamine/thiamine pyrophosphate ABC transporter permease ThiP [Rhodosalinus sp. 5P4]|uniref:thiamine/thiamine pyrophosphate ABC transporter permease ThiP n=1 Tax=Rhodosalinus sp. 5P4 TaxID=3239196 RepID=UPI0035239466